MPPSAGASLTEAHSCEGVIVPGRRGVMAMAKKSKKDKKDKKGKKKK